MSKVIGVVTLALGVTASPEFEAISIASLSVHRHRVRLGHCWSLVAVKRRLERLVARTILIRRGCCSRCMPRLSTWLACRKCGNAKVLHSCCTSHECQCRQCRRQSRRKCWTSRRKFRNVESAAPVRAIAADSSCVVDDRRSGSSLPMDTCFLKSESWWCQRAEKGVSRTMHDGSPLVASKAKLGEEDTVARSSIYASIDGSTNGTNVGVPHRWRPPPTRSESFRNGSPWLIWRGRPFLIERRRTLLILRRECLAVNGRMSCNSRDMSPCASSHETRNSVGDEPDRHHDDIEVLLGVSHQLETASPFRSHGVHQMQLC